MQVRYTDHVLHKLSKELEKLGVTKELVEEVLQGPDEVCYDVASGRSIAIKRNYKLAVVFEREDDRIIVVTVIYSSKLRDIVQRRRAMERWI